MASNAIALPTTHGALRVSRMLPGEVWSEIMRLLAEKDLKNVVLGYCPAPEQAVRLLWEIVNPQNNKLAVLYQKVAHNPQALANHVQSLTINFEAPGEQLATCTLSFPCLQKIKVTHNKRYLEDAYEKTHAHLKTLVGPAPTHLEIGTHEHEREATKPVVDNFLPSLTRCLQLRTLSIRAAVRGSSKEFARAVSACGKLQVLVLDKYTENLVTRDTFKAIASLPKLTSLEINKYVDLPLVSLISSVKTPFESLSSLELSIQADAARSLLPFTPQLRSLRLTIHGTKSIFPTFVKLPVLEHVSLRFKEFNLFGQDYQHLGRLTQLTHLELTSTGEEGDSGLDTSNVCGLFLANVLSELPLLQHFRLHATDTFDDEFLVALGRGCPELTSLYLSGDYKLDLRTETGVIFPCLREFEIGDLIAITLLMDEATEYQLAVNIARAVVTHAPRLGIFHATVQQFDDTLFAYKVEEEWHRQMLSSI
ncbi:hypothetical protein KCU65_g5730, partial [Aureobasidium melanogenum]